MARFDYTLPSGSEFTVIGPDNATQSQADLVFYTQVAAGSVVGFGPGDTLSDPTVDAHAWHLSRLDRGTAGVDSKIELAMITATDVMAGVLGALVPKNPTANVPGGITTTTKTPSAPLTSAQLQNIVENLPMIAGMPNLTEVPVSNPVDQADVMNARGSPWAPFREVGPLTKFDIQTLEAQMSNTVGQDYWVITQEKGIGKFGMDCYSLEKAGYVKPGTWAMFLQNTPQNFVSVMSSPQIWTGLKGVDSLQDLLDDEQLQNVVQNDLMLAGYDAMTASGAITPPPTAPKSKTQGWVYQSGMLTGAGLQALTDTGLVGGKVSEIGGLINAAATDYSTLTSGVATGSITNFPNTTAFYYDKVQATLDTQVNSQIGALVSNASKFGPEPTTVWAARASTGGLQSSMFQAQTAMNATSTNMARLMDGGSAGLSMNATNPVLSTSVSGFDTGARGLTSLSPNIFDQANNGLNMISSSMDLMGKASQYSMGFSNLTEHMGDLTSLSKLGDLASGGLSKVGDIALSQVNQLKGMADGALSSLNSGMDKLGKMDLGSLTDLGKLEGLASQIPGASMIAGGLGALKGLSDKLGSLGSLFSGGGLGKMFGGGNALVAGVKQGVGFTNTINRQTVDSAMSKIIGSAKIPDPLYTLKSAASTAGLTDMSFAQSKLSELGVTTFSGTSGASLGAGADSAALTAKYNSSVPVFSQSQINRSL